MQKRQRKETDQIETEKAFFLIQQCMRKNPGIEPTIWAGAIWSTLVHGYNVSGMSYAEFTHEWNQVKDHYKSWFDK